MNESHPQLYLNLINKLLTCAEGEEQEMLRENDDLIDAELVLMMERVVSVLEERDAKQQAEWLQELANRLAENLRMPLVDRREERGVDRQVRSLERRFGKGHLYFAYHAAFPLALTPDLCYQIWANFQRDIGGKLLNIPWIAVADLLLSGLCHPVGHELYEMDLAVRNLLLKELSNDANFGENRIEQLSTFMLEYVREQINSEDEDIRDVATVQKWTALAYVRPDAAAKELALTLREKVREGNKAELVRLSSVLENLAEPLRGKYEPLLVYSRGMGRLARGDLEGASREFQRLGEVRNWLSVSEVGLPIPGDVGDVFGDLRLRLEWKEISEKRRQEYLNLIQLLLDCLAGEEGEMLRRHQHLVDSVLVEIMRRVAASLAEKGEPNVAEFLRDIANKLTEAFNLLREVKSTEAEVPRKLDRPGFNPYFTRVSPDISEEKRVTLRRNTRVVSSSLEKQATLRNALKTAGLSQAKLSEIAGVSINTIKRLLGTKRPSRVNRWAVEIIAKALNIEPTDIVDDWFGKPYPEEFESLIKEKTRIFCGRELVFKRFKRFLQENDKGYFTVTGDPGAGKTSIAAKYVLDRGAICYFNTMLEGRNRPELFLESIRQQLRERYDLDNVEHDGLAALLVKTRKQLGHEEPIVIVVDGLDEVEDNSTTHNLLNLPKNLPERVYFFLTGRFGHKRLYVEVPSEELDLSNETDDEIKKMNRDDAKAFIQLFLNEDSEYKDRLRDWIETRQIAVADFVDLLAEKSEGSFIYLRYLLPAIANGNYNNFSIKELPDGLLQYYEYHWQRMGMTGKNQEDLAILFVLLKAGKPVSCKFIANMVGRDEYEVLEVLEQWRGFLKKTFVETEKCYAIYHPSFEEFLQNKPMIQGMVQLLSGNSARFLEQLEASEGEEE